MKWCDEYLNKVASQVRVRRARQPLAEELRDHLECQRQAYRDDGLSEEEARRRALLDMGGPLLVGGELDRAHRPRTSWAGILTALALMSMGFALRRLYSGSQSRISLLALVVPAGLMLLFGCTDYTMWLKAAAPAAGVWALLAAYRIYILHASAWNVSLFVVYTMVPQVLAVILPVLLAMLISRLRGRGFGAFAACLALTVLTLATAAAYRDTGYDPYPVALMALLGFGVLALAVREGFFRLNHRIAYGIIALGVLASAALIVRQLIRELSVQQEYWSDVIFPLVRHARLVGRSRGFGLLSAPDAGMFLSNQAFGFFFLAGMVALCGWLPFAALVLGIVAAFVWLYRRFLPTENRMGRLIGLAGTATLTAQAFLHFLSCFAGLTQQLCLPLLSQGNVMMLMDAAIVGMLLSVMRGANLPEAGHFSREVEPFAGMSRV